MQIRFTNNIKQSSKEFKVDIYCILNEIKTYIPRLITRSDKPYVRERLFIIRTTFTIDYGIFSAWRFCKDYQYKRNLGRTFHLYNRFPDGLRSQL